MPQHRRSHAARRAVSNRARRIAPVAAALALCALAAACSSANSSPPTWRPQPSFTGDGGQGATNEIPGAPTGGGTATTPSQPSGGSGSSTSTVDPNVVATKLTTPTAIAVLPTMSALVGERTTGKILMVQPVAGKPTPVVKTITGISTAGGGGLLDLMLSPYYDSDGLVFAYITTATDNRVVEFTLKGPVTPVLTGIPRGAAHNAGRLATDGKYVYVATGDAGKPATATSLNGKVLRVTDIGRPAPGNPTASSPVYASGATLSNGLCYDATRSLLFQADPQSRVNLVDSGADLAGTDSTLANLPTGYLAPGGCAVQENSIYVTSTDGQALLAADIKAGSGGRTTFAKFDAVVKKTYGRLLTVVAADDGSLWMTTTNKDGKGKPIATDERVIRIMAPQGGGGDSPV